MSILIKGMKMPENCRDCLLCAGQANMDYGVCVWCRADGKTRDAYTRQDCPLVLVPPHYDLIDHNALKIAVMDCDAETRIDFLKHAMDCINKAPVVIPSDMPTYEVEKGET